MTRHSATPAAVIGAFKSIVANEWLRLLKQAGEWHEARVWHRGYFEHIVRDQRELDRLREYIANNPANWRFDCDNPEREASQEYLKAWSWVERW